MKFLRYVQDNDLSCTVTVTDTKGLRTLPPSKQADRDCYVHVDEIRDDGIVISGFKCNQTGILFAHEVIIVPTTNMKPDEKDFAVACAVPADAPGMTFVLGRTPQDKRFFEMGGDIEGIDLGKLYADHQAMVYFDKVCPERARLLCAARPTTSAVCSPTSPRCTALPPAAARPAAARPSAAPPASSPIWSASARLATSRS